MNNGWTTRRFGEVLEIRNGRNQREVQVADGKYPIYGSAGNLMGYANQYICEAGTTIIGRKGSINNPIYVDEPFWNVDTAFGLAAKEELDSRYLFYFCRSYDFGKLNRGTTIPSLVKTELLQITMPIPPIGEQKRIVAILDEAYEGINRAKQNAEKNLQNARELFESHLQSVFTDSSGEWEEKTLSQLTTILGDGLHGTPKYSENGDFYFINGNNLDDGEIAIKENTKRVSFEEYEKYKKNLNERTVLVSINGTLGNVAFYNNEKVILGKSACYFNLIEGVDKNFIKYVLVSPYFVKYAHKEATGATIKNVSLKTMRELKIHLPPLSIQKHIVAELDGLSAQVGRLESVYRRKLAALDELKKSLLHRAFKGQLQGGRTLAKEFANG